MGSPVNNRVNNLTRVLSASYLSPNILNCEYAVRGSVLLRSLELEKQLKDKPGSLPFDKILFANIGNPQAVGQKPMSFLRQIISGVVNPKDISAGTPSDIRERVEKYTQTFNPGAYTHSKGAPVFRQEVADFLTRRDGVVGDPENVFLTDGASPGVKMLLDALIRSNKDGILIPYPQYPLYSALITQLGGTAMPYYLKEENQWGLDLDEVTKTIEEFRPKGVIARAFVMVNPGNPTGAMFYKKDIEDVIRLCSDSKLVLLADEVYQENVYTEKAFYPARKVMNEMGVQVELASLHSTSKGLAGECGLRGGFLYLDNFDEEVMAQFYKLRSVNLCSNTIGQLAIASVVNPPQPGSESYKTYQTERNEIFEGLKRKAKFVAEQLNQLDGVSCQPAAGAMYLFPSVTLPQKALDEAKRRNQAADLMYCLEMLENTGLVCVPGSGFGQRQGTWHYRITILPNENDLKDVMKRLAKFHNEFLATYR
eukprot:Platyproteum_vivax@DN884_c0_g1_i1.p1